MPLAVENRTMQEQELAGKVAIVTGAGRMRSIGRPIARLLARAGAKVVITGTGRSPDRYPDDEKAAGWRDIESVRAEIEAAGGTCLALVSDISSETAVQALVRTTVEKLGRLDIVVNNAGAARGADRVPVVELAADVWKKVIETNLDGTFLLSREAARHMLKQGTGGSIINISSIASKRAGKNTAAYAASKAGINALSRAMSQELGKDGIRVNALCPGIIDTYRMDDVGRDDAWRQLIKNMIPLGYAGDGNEVAELCLFLASERGKWITGQAVNIDGGTVWQ